MTILYNYVTIISNVTFSNSVTLKIYQQESVPEYNTNGFPYITVTIMRASNATDRVTVKDLISCKKEDIYHGRCVGKKRMEHLVSWMDKYHLKFADEADTI